MRTVALALAVATLGASMLGASSARGQRVGIDPIRRIRLIAKKAPECASLAGNDVRAANVWESAKHPALYEHCLVLAESYTFLRDPRNPWRAIVNDQVPRAERLSPRQPGTKLLAAFAYARQERDAEDALALAAFAEAEKASPAALDDAELQDAYGALLLRTAVRDRAHVDRPMLDRARTVFRRLLPRAVGKEGLCEERPECDPAALAYWTAGMLALAVGPTAVDEAVAILRDARDRASYASEVRRSGGYALALALDRRGDVEQARILADQVRASLGLPLETPDAQLASRMPEPAEAYAIRAIALGGADPEGAKDAWRKYLAAAGEGSVWAAHAKTHLAGSDKLDKSGKAKPGGGAR